MESVTMSQGERTKFGRTFANEENRPISLQSFCFSTISKNDKLPGEKKKKVSLFLIIAHNRWSSFFTNETIFIFAFYIIFTLGWVNFKTVFPLLWFSCMRRNNNSDIFLFFSLLFKWKNSWPWQFPVSPFEGFRAWTTTSYY